MKVTAHWVETVEYATVVEINDDQYFAWLHEQQDMVQHSPEWVQEYLEQQGADAWVPPEPDRDFVCISDRGIREVVLGD